MKAEFENTKMVISMVFMTSKISAILFHANTSGVHHGDILWFGFMAYQPL